MDIIFTLVVLVLAVLIVLFVDTPFVAKLAQVGGIAYLLMILLTLIKYLIGH